MANAPKVTQNQSDAASDPGTATPASSLSEIAREEFGDAFHGDVTPQSPPKPPTPDEEPDDLQPEIDEGDLDEGGENKQVEGDEADASKPEAAEAADEPISSVKELVEHLEADPEWFDGLKVDVVVNDKTSQVPLKELVANYQKNEAADERLEQAKIRSQQAQEEATQRNAALEQQFAIAAGLVQQIEQQLTADIAAINWDQLKQEDPAMWSAERVRFGEKVQQIQQTKAAVAAQYQQAAVTRHQDVSGQYANRLQEENKLLMEKMPKVSPDWGDPEKLPQRKAELADYLIKAGFSRDDVLGASDHRLLVAAEKARLWDLTQGKVQVTKKRIANVPKVMKPGARREPTTVNLEKVREAQKKLRTSGKMDDALALLRMKQNRR